MVHVDLAAIRRLLSSYAISQVHFPHARNLSSPLLPLLCAQFGW
jgi:hypothetical protein